MKRWFLAISFSLLFIISCKKANLVQDEALPITAVEQASIDKVIVSDWEPLKEWHVQASPASLIFSKDIDEKIDDNTVLVFVRNLWKDDPTFTMLNEPDEPLMMPFNFLPFNKQPSYTETWNYRKLNNRLDIELKLSNDQETALANNKLEFQYIIIPKDVLSAKGQSEESVHQMSYDEVVRTFGLSS